mmetsp:Transcript_59451/g.181442  ORF Transcript_59451/g.181442 Transcript_59451/m.181442 type:complete len:241 (+) Transcript_59451:383-1105(+)
MQAHPPAASLRIVCECFQPGMVRFNRNSLRKVLSIDCAMASNCGRERAVMIRTTSQRSLIQKADMSKPRFWSAICTASTSAVRRGSSSPVSVRVSMMGDGDSSSTPKRPSTFPCRKIAVEPLPTARPWPQNAPATGACRAWAAAVLAISLADAAVRVGAAHAGRWALPSATASGATAAATTKSADTAQRKGTAGRVKSARPEGRLRWTSSARRSQIAAMAKRTALPGRAAGGPPRAPPNR